MKRLYALSALVLLGPILSAGCSGGHDSCCSSSSKAVARQRAIVTMRITRATLAVAGFARRQTRAPGIHMGNRIGTWLNAVRQLRSISSPSTPTTPTLDTDTGLYYTLTVNPDGSGQQNLFVDSAAQTPAGAFTFTATQWTSDQPGNYPATFQTVYQITAGNFAGEHGTISIKSDDATGDNGTMNIDLTDSQGEHCITDFTITNGVLKAKAHCTFADNSSYDSIFNLIGDVISCSTTYPDGGTQEISVNSDGSATEIIDNSDGQSEATGTIDPNGNDTIDYNDGSSETVDVDTGDDSGGASTTESVKRRTKAATMSPPRVIPQKR